MEKKQIRKINIHASRIYFTIQKLKDSNCKSEHIDYDKRLKDVLERGKTYARDKSKEE